MPEHPLLLFPSPETASRSPLGGGSPNFRLPSPQRQWDRLSPAFDQLQQAFHSRRIGLQQTASGIDPEEVLVIETIGSVENFANAVKLIEGFEWMGEIELDEIIPDDIFFDEAKPDKQLSGRLYLVMSNQRALEEMLSLWSRYIADQDFKFERGLTKFRDVFLHLKNIRRWDVQDRLLETGIIQIWQEDLELDGDRAITFEIELWFRGNTSERSASAVRISDLISAQNGQILNQCIIEDIAYHGILAELPANAIRYILDTRATELVRCDNIMFFRPSGQIVVGDRQPEGDTGVTELLPLHPAAGEPIIGLLDGVPLSNHRLLSDRIVIDDPDNWESEYSASERVHGTAMASLIIHGDLSDPTTPLSRPIYCRPIMKPIDWFRPPRHEGIPATSLAIDLIHRSVKRIFEGDQDEAATAPSIKVINLSIGDRARHFSQTPSPLAKLLDWLSVKYDVLFIVSAGNHLHLIQLPITGDDFYNLDTTEKENIIVDSIYRDTRNRKILSPSETINGITVGAIHFDNSKSTPDGNRFNPFTQPLPSPISAFGNGHRKSIKPDMVYYGGKQLYTTPLRHEEQAGIEPSTTRNPPGNKFASPSSTPGDISATSYGCGTSNATALTTRSAGLCYETLQQIFASHADDLDTSGYDAPLIKAMLAHGCSWGESASYLEEKIVNTGFWQEIRRRIEFQYIRPGDYNKEINRHKRSLISRWIGYGIPQVERVLSCTDQRATLLGFGQLTNDRAHVFSLPLPPSLSSRQEQRRLTVTLAWLSPISSGTQKYRTASLWFETTKNGLTPTRLDADWQSVRRGTLQHEIFVGDKAEPFIDGENLEIKVNCREDAGKILQPVKYGLIVSIEVSEGLDIHIYDEIRSRITPAIRIQQIPSRGSA